MGCDQRPGGGRGGVVYSRGPDQQNGEKRETRSRGETKYALVAVGDQSKQRNQKPRPDTSILEGAASFWIVRMDHTITCPRQQNSLAKGAQATVPYSVEQSQYFRTTVRATADGEVQPGMVWREKHTW